MERKKQDIPGRTYSIFNDKRQTSVFMKWNSSDCSRVYYEWIDGSDREYTLGCLITDHLFLTCLLQPTIQPFT